MKLPITHWPMIGLLFCLFMFVPLQDQAQVAFGTEHKFVQFIVKDLSSIEDARSIDRFIRGQEGIFMSRTDPNTQICFIIFPTTASLSKATFSNWVADFGYQIDCYREGIHGKDKVYSKEQFPCN